MKLTFGTWRLDLEDKPSGLATHHPYHKLRYALLLYNICHSLAYTGNLVRDGERSQEILGVAKFTDFKIMFSTSLPEAVFRPGMLEGLGRRGCPP